MTLIVLLKGVLKKGGSTSNEANSFLGISLIFLAEQKESWTFYSFSINGLNRFDKSLDMP